MLSGGGADRQNEERNEDGAPFFDTVTPTIHSYIDLAPSIYIQRALYPAICLRGSFYSSGEMHYLCAESGHFIKKEVLNGEEEALLRGYRCLQPG